MKTKNFMKNSEIMKTVSSSMISFSNDLSEVLDKHAPVLEKYISVHQKPKWMDAEYLAERRKRRALYKKWKL